MSSDLAAPTHAAGIYVMKPDGSGTRKVVEVAGCDRHGSAQWSHDGRRLAFDATRPGVAAPRWFVVNADGAGLREMGDSAMPCWSPDDKQLVFQRYAAPGVKPGTWVQNVDGRGRQWLVDGLSPRWSPDGSRIAYTDWKSIKVLDLISEQDIVLHAGPDDDEPPHRIQAGFDWSGNRLAFVRDAAGPKNESRELIITGPEGATVRLARPEIEGYLSWSPDGKKLAIVIAHQLYMLDADGSGDPQLVPGQSDRNSDPAWSPDGRWLAFSSNRKARELPPVAAAERTWKLVETARHPKGSIVYGLGFTPDGRRLVMGGDPIDEGVQVLDLTTGATTNLGGHGISIAMFPKGDQFVTSWLSRIIQIIELETGDIVREMDHGSTVRTIALSRDGNRLLSGGLDHLLHVWNPANGEKICTFNQHKTWITRAVFSADGKQVISASDDKKLYVWDAQTGKNLDRTMKHPENVWGLAVSPDGQHVLTGTGGDFIANPINLYIGPGKDNALRVWELASGKLVGEMKGHTNTVYTVDVSADGRLAVSGSWDGTVRLWDLETHRELSRMEGGQGSVTRVLFSPDGKQVIAAGGVSRQPNQILTFPNEQVRLYEVVEVQPVGP